MKRLFSVLLLSIFTFLLAGISLPANAASPIGCPNGPQGPVGNNANYNCPEGGAVINGTYDSNGSVTKDQTTSTTATDSSKDAKCGGVATSIDYGCGSSKGGPIYGFLRGIIKFAGGLVGLLVIMMLIIGGIRYITSAGNPKLVAAAKNQITNAIIGLVLFALMLAILNFLLPGGIIG
jgi:hypothetical protein